MFNLFLILLMISIILLVVGIIKPSISLKFLDKEKQTRKNVFKFFGIISLICFIGMMITVESPENNEEEMPEINNKLETETPEEIETPEEVSEEEGVDEERVTDTNNEVTEEEIANELDDLQKLYMNIDNQSRKEIIEMVEKSNLYYSEKEYAKGPTVKIAYTKGVSKLSYADSGDSLKISYSENENGNIEIENVEYFSSDKFIQLIDYRHGTYWKLRDQPEYAGYYISVPGKEIGTFVVKYDNGNEAETGYLTAPTKEEQFKFYFNYEEE